MLIETLDKLTSGRLVSKIVFTNSEVTARPPGIKVAFADSDEHADAWICRDETGIWLSSYESNASGFEEPLSSIREIVFAVTKGKS